MAQVYCSLGQRSSAMLGTIKWADSNGIILLYPQATATLANPDGCWDWWGYDDPNYPLKSGRQIMAVHKMIERISRAP
jgi:poly(3-hydroxybutyrate) depolymerase